MLVNDHQSVAFRAAYLITGDSGEAEDVTQEAFFKAYLSLSSFRSGSSFRPWLLKIVTNEASNSQMTPEQLVLASERSRYLLTALRQLSPADQAVIACKYLLELNEAEIAEFLGRPRGTVKSRLSRALQRLRDSLTDLQTEVIGIGTTE
jgi:RNA polymerase sigma-70 factor (ECF subfamily)